MLDEVIKRQREKLDSARQNILCLAKVYKDLFGKNVFDEKEIVLQFHYWAYIDDNKHIRDLLENTAFEPEVLTNAETIRRARQLLKEQGIIIVSPEKQEAMNEKETAMRNIIKSEKT